LDVLQCDNCEFTIHEVTLHSVSYTCRGSRGMRSRRGFEKQHGPVEKILFRRPLEHPDEAFMRFLEDALAFDPLRQMVGV
jgi:hypothetical protein